METSTATAAGEARLIGLDWGESTLRAWLFDGEGAAIARASAPSGVFALPGRGAYRPAFETLCAPWLAACPGLPVIACGLVGGRDGWCESGWASAPASLEDLAARLHAHDGEAGRTFRVVPGVLARGEVDSTDTMRGEETRVFGAMQPWLREHPHDRGHDDALFLLPGTHSRWVEVRQRRIVALRSYLTGELHALLTGGSSLSRLAAAPAEGDAAQQADALRAFDEGIDLAARSPAALSHLLYTARSRGLAGQLEPHALAAFASGLLIAAELADALRWRSKRLPLTIVGTSGLAARYAHALARLGETARVAQGEPAAEGLFAIARAAGLVSG